MWKWVHSFQNVSRETRVSRWQGGHCFLTSLKVSLAPSGMDGASVCPSGSAIVALGDVIKTCADLLAHGGLWSVWGDRYLLI